MPVSVGSSIIFIVRGGIPRPVGDFPESLNQAILAGTILVERLCVTQRWSSWRKLYYTILYYTIIYCTILYYTILFYTIRYDTLLYQEGRAWAACAPLDAQPDKQTISTYLFIHKIIYTPDVLTASQACEAQDSRGLELLRGLRSVFIISNRKKSNWASQILKANMLLICPYCLTFQIARV